MQATLAKKDPSSLIHESKQLKPYRRSWRSVRGLTHFKYHSSPQLSFFLWPIADSLLWCGTQG
jgi:hypothetical protein